ncbi:amidohydrolase family protein [Ceratobasidium sp. AG-Ba]|nr:amidohydrolase family protein [Ceratobasidium sp. AG-Ba]
MMATPIAQVFIGNVVNTPVLGRLDILQEQVILVDINGMIADVCPLATPSPAALHYLHNTPQHAIIRLPPTSFFAPTFVDLHLHAPQFMYLGTGLHLPLLIWLDEYAYKAEERLDADPELAKKVYFRLAQRLAENGTGAVLAFGTIKEDTNIILAEAFAALGLRIFVGKLTMDQSSLEREIRPRNISRCLLSSRAIFAHCTFLEIPELGRLREAGCAVAHCPLSNAYFSTLPFRLREALDMGVKVGLGTDVAGGYQVDMMGAMRQAVITSRMRNGFQTELVPGDAPFSIDWKESLYMATRGGAIALGMKSGIIEPGAPFDVQRIDFFNAAGEGLGDMDFFDVPTMLTEPIVEKWWCLGNSANRLSMWVQGRKIF